MNENIYITIKDIKYFGSKAELNYKEIEFFCSSHQINEYSIIYESIL